MITLSLRVQPPSGTPSFDVEFQVSSFEGTITKLGTDLINELALESPDIMIWFTKDCPHSGYRLKKTVENRFSAKTNEI
jgi:hypothetical protein